MTITTSRGDTITTAETVTPFGPTGEVVYERTYSRVKPDGQRETWPETVDRVARGNLGLVYGDQSTWSKGVQYEFDRLTGYMRRFAILPAGRHLWASGVKGRQYLFNCHVTGWEGKSPDHTEFTFLRLMEGGGVGANYSSRFIERFGAPRRELKVHLVCDPEHADYQEMLDAGVLSTEFDAEWAGAFEVEDSREGWAAALVDMLDTYMTDDDVTHEDRVYDVTNVRKRGSRLKTFGGTASGPCPFAQMMMTVSRVMNGAYIKSVVDDLWLEIGDSYVSPIEHMEIDHAVAECVVSGGVRRSARMSILHWLDPFIFDFLACKEDGSKHWTTNISVEIDDAFLAALNDPSDALHSHAFYVHERVVTGMLTNGEPGYWNSTLTNKGEVFEVVATNPCGEIGLPEWGACCLGHVNLDAFAPTTERKSDYLGMIEAHRLVTRFLVRATFGDMNDPKQLDVMSAERRIGVGHLGVQGYFAKRELRYSDVPKDRAARSLLRELKAAVRKEARDYAFELRIPEPVKVTTVAPTGSIAKLPGATEGIHPVLFRYFLQRVRFSLADPDQAAKVEGYRLQGYNVETCVYDKSGNTAVVSFPTKHKLVEELEAMGLSADLVESASEISMKDMLAFQAMYQELYADNAVSFTVNVPAEPHQAKAMLAHPEDKVLPPTSARVTEVMAVLGKALPFLKGTTLMLDGSRPQAPYEEISEADFRLYESVMVGDGIDENCATGACPVR